MLDYLMGNKYAWALLSLCTIFSLIFGIYSYIKGRRKKEISYYKTYYEFIRAGESVIPELKLTFKNQVIEDLVISKYAIWNSGNELLEWSDIVETKPLRIFSIDDKTRILDVKIIQQSDDANEFVVKEVESTAAKLKFNYVGVREGVVLQIIHTGNSSSIAMDCKIKGGKKLKQLNKIIKKTKKKKTKKFVINLLMIIETILLFYFVFFGVLGVINFITDFMKYTFSFYEIIILSIAVFLVMLAAPLIMLITYIKTLKKVYYIDIPINLRKAMEYDEYYD